MPGTGGKLANGHRDRTVILVKINRVLNIQYFLIKFNNIIISIFDKSKFLQDKFTPKITRQITNITKIFYDPESKNLGSITT